MATSKEGSSIWRRGTLLVLTGLVLLLPSVRPASAELLYLTEGNRLRRVDLDALYAGHVVEEVFIEAAARPEDAPSVHEGGRRDINGMVCRFPDGSGRFVASEDTGQPGTRPGWGVFSAEGVQIGKLTATYRAELGDPYGCAFDSAGRLFTTSVGNKGFGASKGQLLLWFPPYDTFPGRPGEYPDTDASSASFCKLASDIGTAGAGAIDAEGRVYVASSSRGAIHRFSPPFPRSPDREGGCAARDALGSPLADGVEREVFARGLYTFAGLAFSASGSLYASSVFTGEIVEIDPQGEVVRTLLDPPGLLPPFETGTPHGIAVDSRGTLYYADLDLTWDFPGIDTGPNGKVWRIRFDADGAPLEPELVLEGLAFPDAVSVLPGSLEESPRGQ